MNRMTRKSISILLAVIAALCLTLGTVWAYFTDYDILRGSARLNLSGRTELDEDVTDRQKTVSVKNTGDADVIVRIMIYGPEGIKVSGDESWTIEDNGGGSFTGYYNSILKPGESTDTVTAAVEDIPKTADNADFEIIVLQECSTVKFDENNNVIAPDSWTGFPDIKAA